MRLFIAINVSQETTEHFKELQKKLSGKLNLTKTFHNTLKFLGEISPQKTEEVKKKLEAINFKEFTATLNGTGVFPSEDYIRIVWVALEPKEIICELQAQIDEALKDLFEKEKDYVPHITIARVKAIEDKKQFAESVRNLQVRPIKFQVKEFKLIESTLTAEGPVYREIAVYPAKGL